MPAASHRAEEGDLMAYTAPEERDQYLMYLRKSRYDRDYAELSVEETLQRHEAILTKTAAERGYYIADSYREVVTGESLAVRPEAQKMLEAVSSSNYAGVLVVDLERLARGNGADQAYISQLFKYSGTKIITPAKEYDPSNEFDEEYFEFGLFMSRREYKTINRRLVRGRQSSASEGKYVGSIPPYGYDRTKIPDEKGYTLTPNPEEAAAVQTIFELYTQHVGPQEIANRLNDRGIPTRHGDLWTRSTIVNILSNPVYIGKIRRGYCKETKSIDDNGHVISHVKHLSLHEYQRYDGKHEAIIDAATFDLAQKIKAERAPSPKVKSGEELQNAFAGLIFCAVCGKRIARTTDSKRKEPRFRCENARNCHNSSAYYSVVEREVISALMAWLEGYRVKIDTVGFADEIEDCRRRVEAAEREKAKVKQQLDKAFDLMEREECTIEEFRERRDKHNARVAALDAEIAAAKEKLAALENSETSRANLIPQTEALLESYDDMTPLERNKLLKEIVDRIEYRKDENGITIDLYPKLPKMQ